MQRNTTQYSIEYGKCPRLYRNPKCNAIRESKVDIYRVKYLVCGGGINDQPHGKYLIDNNARNG